LGAAGVHNKKKVGEGHTGTKGEQVVVGGGGGVRGPGGTGTVS